MIRYIPILFMCGLAQAQPTQLVAQTAWHEGNPIFLLSTPCDPVSGTMRAQQVLGVRHLKWGCWGYNDTGVQIIWQSGSQTYVPYRDLWNTQAPMPESMGYQRLHRRVQELRNQ